MSAYKIDLRWPASQRFTDRTETRDPVLALAAFRSLLQRSDLEGEDVAARLVVAGKSLYYSNFRKPLGGGRIHPDAPLKLPAEQSEADELARWLPASAARPGSVSGAAGGRAAGGTALPAGSTVADLTVPLRLDTVQALALAQFVKRIDRDTCRRHAWDAAEADAIYDSFIRLRDALAEVGFAPR